MNSSALIYCYLDHQKQEERRRLQSKFGDMDSHHVPLPKSRVQEFMSAIKNKFEMFTENTGTIDDEVYFHFEDRFDFPDDQWNQYMVLLRSIYVHRKHRRKGLAKEVLARTVEAASESGACILALARPFEILLPDGKEAREFFTSTTFCAYSDNIGKKARMMDRFRSAADVDFKEIIAKRLVA